MTRKEVVGRMEATFDRCLDVVVGKSEDYAKEGDAFSNFAFAAGVAKVTVEQVFLVMLGVKLSRLSELLTSEREPVNESVDDTLVDMVNYGGLLKAWREK